MNTANTRVLLFPLLYTADPLTVINTNGGLKMKYHILTGDLQKLEREVNELIEKGWKPQGGVSRAESDCYSWFAQAMIKD
jgi:hypothetical protein